MRQKEMEQKRMKLLMELALTPSMDEARKLYKALKMIEEEIRQATLN